MKRWLWRYTYAFRTNNNVRLATCWVIVIVLLIFNLLVFGFAPKKPTELSETAQRYYNLYNTGTYATNDELRSGWNILIRVPTTIWGWLRTAFWWIWIALLVWSLIYTPISRRDEFRRAIQSVKRRWSERQGGSSEAPLAQRLTSAPAYTEAPAQPSIGGAIWQNIFTQARIFSREFAAAFLGDILFSKKRR